MDIILSDYSSEDQSTLRTVVDFSEVEDGDYRAGMKHFIISCKQESFAAAGRAGWVHMVCLDQWTKYEGQVSKVKKGIKAVLALQITWCTDADCPPLYYCDPADMSLVGNNPLSQAYRKFVGALDVHDINKGKEWIFDPKNKHTTMKKCDEFRRERKAILDKGKQEEEDLQQMREDAIKELSSEVECFDPEGNDEHAAMLAARIKEAQEWEPDEAKQATEKRAGQREMTLADVAAFTAIMTFDQKCEAFGLTEYELDGIMLGRRMQKLAELKKSELDDDEAAETEVTKLFEKFGARLENQIELSAAKIESLEAA